MVTAVKWKPPFAFQAAAARAFVRPLVRQLKAKGLQFKEVKA
jgi:hypothetical protein